MKKSRAISHEMDFQYLRLHQSLTVKAETVSETVKIYSIRRLTAGEDFIAFARYKSSNSYTLPRAHHSECVKNQIKEP
jgi:hypothetical protein